MSSHIGRRIMFLIGTVGLMVLCIPFLTAQPARAQSPVSGYDVTQQCFAVSDEMAASGSSGKNSLDALVRLNRTNGQTTVIGMTGTEKIEAIAFGPMDTLYAADANRLGILDLNTGVFTPKPQLFGSGNGTQGVVAFNDADGLFYDVANNILWGVQRVSSKPDVLFQIDPVTGARVANAFGAGKDYVEVQAPKAGSSTLGDLDDIAIDPVDDVMYGAANSGGTGGILVMVDRITGATTPVAEFRYPTPYGLNPIFAGQIVDDIEGLSFFNDGQLYGSTGNNGPDNNDKNQLFMLDKTTGAATRVGAFPAGHMDYEGLACLTAPAFISLRKYTNGEDANTPTGPNIPLGNPVTWTYIITNTGSITLTDLVLTDDKVGLIGPGGLSNCPPAGTILGPGDSLTCTATGVAQLGQYANTGLVTGITQIGVVAPRQTVTATDPSHYFGLAGPAIVIKKATNGEDADTPTGPLIPVGGAVTWTYVVTNTGNVILSPVTVTDDRGVLVSCPKNVLAPQENMLCTGTGIAVAGQYANIGTAVGIPPAGPPVTSTDPSHYFGYIPASVGNIVFGDIDPTGSTPEQIEAGNGLQDSGEVGIDGIIVQLYNATTNTLISETVTADGGHYLFTNLPPGEYYIVFINPFPEGVWTAPNIGIDDEIDSDPTSNSAITDPRGEAQVTEVFRLESGEVDLSWDAGLVGLSSTASATVGDFVWFDLNKNGMQDAGENGFAGVPVRLVNADTGAVVRTTQTNANGLYLFTGVDPGNYWIEFDIPTNFTISSQNAGVDDEKDSDVDPTTKRTAVFTLPSFTTDLRWDAGLFQTGTGLPLAAEPGQSRLFLPLVRK